MRTTVLFIAMALLFITAVAQEKVQEVHSIDTNFESIQVVRLKPGTDLLDGLAGFIKEKQVHNAVILAGIGSVSQYHFHVVSDKNLPPAEEFPKASVPKDITSVQGYIFDGRVHAHITLSDENSVIGGHLEPGTKALTFAIFTIGILPGDLKMNNLDNYNF